MKKKATIITVVVVVVLAVGGWLFYRNQQTIPEQFANKNLTTYDPPSNRFCNGKSSWHVGEHSSGEK